MQTIEISDAAYARIMSRRSRPEESFSTVILREINSAAEPHCIICDEVRKARAAPSTEWSSARKKLGLD